MTALQGDLNSVSVEINDCYFIRGKATTRPWIVAYRVTAVFSEILLRLAQDQHCCCAHLHGSCLAVVKNCFKKKLQGCCFTLPPHYYYHLYFAHCTCNLSLNNASEASAAVNIIHQRIIIIYVCLGKSLDNVCFMGPFALAVGSFISDMPFRILLEKKTIFKYLHR